MHKNLEIHQVTDLLVIETENSFDNNDVLGLNFLELPLQSLIFLEAVNWDFARLHILQILQAIVSFDEIQRVRMVEIILIGVLVWIEAKISSKLSQKSSNFPISNLRYLKTFSLNLILTSYKKSRN